MQEGTVRIRMLDLSRQGITELLRKAAGKAAGRLLPALAGFLLARTGIVGGLFPFGAAAAVGAPEGTALPVLLGVLLGCIVPGGPVETLRCAASALAAAGIRWALAEFKPVRESPLFRPAAALAGVVLTGTVVTSAVGAAISFDLLLYLAEGAMAAACAYFFCCGAAAWRRREKGLSTPELCSLAAALGVLCIPLCRLTVLGFSPAVVLTAAAVLYLASRFGAAGGAAAGVAMGAVIALADGRFAPVGVLAIAGLMAALFFPLGRVAGAAAFTVCCTIGQLASGSADVYFIMETLLGAAMFTIIRSDRLEVRLERLLRREERPSARQPSGYVAERLRTAALGLEEASRTVCEVTERLDRLDAPQAGVVCRRATEELCADCAISRFCWETSREQTRQMFDRISLVLRQEGRLTRSNTPAPSRSRCARWGEMSERINALYAEHQARENARRRITQVRAALAGQLGGVGELLCELADESGETDARSERLTALAARALGEYELDVRDVGCVCRPSGAVQLTLALLPDPDEDPEEQALDAVAVVSEALGLGFGEPEIGVEQERITVSADSLPVYSVSFGAAQHSRGAARLCGDAYDALPQADGGTVVMLSDGMGSGGRAAVDAAMACGLMRRLISSGFGERGAMRLVNSAMLVRSDDESLATMDCVRISLYSGEAVFHKAGAAASYVKRGGSVKRIELPSLPLGIMKEIDCVRGERSLQAGDMIVMVSDGAAGEEDDWLARELASRGSEDVRRLARDLTALASARLPQGADDDVTVLVLRLDEAGHRSGVDAA